MYFDSFWDNVLKTTKSTYTLFPMPGLQSICISSRYNKQLSAIYVPSQFPIRHPSQLEAILEFPLNPVHE